MQITNRKIGRGGVQVIKQRSKETKGKPSFHGDIQLLSSRSGIPSVIPKALRRKVSNEIADSTRKSKG